MLIATSFLTLLSRFLYAADSEGTCIPNSRFVLNGRICFCNSVGEWSESICDVIGRRTVCQPGYVTWHGCKQCVCQDDGKFFCTNACFADTSDLLSNEARLKGLATNLCTPLKTYYVDCNVCSCPASGLAAEAHCAIDASCSMQEPSISSDFLVSVSKKVCLPKVMYRFPCLRCLCSDNGYFLLDKCTDMCLHASKQIEDSRKCIPRTFYKGNNVVCLCSDDSTRDNKICAKIDAQSDHSTIKSLRSSVDKYTPYVFTKPRCFYCVCKSNGTVDKDNCFEAKCMTSDKAEYNIERETCSPEEIVSVCVECFSLKNQSIVEPYCTRACSAQHKLQIIEKVLNDSFTKSDLLNRSAIQFRSADYSCVPNSLYINQGIFCLCPESGNSEYKLCTDMKYEVGVHTSNEKLLTYNRVSTDYNITCEPNTFVDIDCNTCFCSKKGTVDPKWCTYDDCVAKKKIMKSHTQNSTIVDSKSSICIPGSVSKENCNYCICPANGKSSDKVCTINKCTDNPMHMDKLTCEPLEYYEVDCNVCFCPKDGVKNLVKCTKNICESNYLRSGACDPGELFSHECNICICPSNGNKAERVCTNHTCPDTALGWKKIFQVSQSETSNSASFTSKILDVCFPGEQFRIGCKLCICPDMGLRSYATCLPAHCEDEMKTDAGKSLEPKKILKRQIGNTQRVRVEEEVFCFKYTIPVEDRERPQRQCTAGSMYIVRCQQCICPYLGSLIYFCRPLPDDVYCEKAFPGVDYVPAVRRNYVSKNTTVVITSGSPVANYSDAVIVKHSHTKYPCETPGKVMDNCYMCECQEDKTIIQEHCFKSDAPACVGVNASFLLKSNKMV